MRKLMFVAVLVGVAALTIAVTAVAADYRGDSGPEVAPSFIPGKLSNECGRGGQKLDGTGGDLTSGTYPFTFDGFAGSITITVSQGQFGPQFEFVTDDPVDTDGAGPDGQHVVTSIGVKGGPDGANWYDYAGGGFTDVGADNGLHSPNKNATKWYGLSHICVYTDKK